MQSLQDSVYAAPEDVFPELFVNFLGVPAPLRAALIEAHGEIFDPAWWRSLQDRLRAGDYVDVPPYPAETRLAHQCALPGREEASQ
jgi:isocitrate dehydrogenase kinase/phosphatase